ncbi:MAG: glycosyltransferase family 4 protein [Acidimicrobiia bacterium]
MRILHVNKFLYRRGGAEAYMEDLAALQTAAGHHVEFFGMAHPLNRPMRFAGWFPRHIELEPPPPTALGKAKGASRILWSTSAAEGMARVVDAFEPDVVHLHNIYHQLSPSLLRPLQRRGIPAVMTLHDYKLACPTYQFLDHGQPCQACLGGHYSQAIRRRCKGGSLPASTLAAVELWIHTTLRAYHPVARFICPSRFLARKMAEAGVFPDRLRWVPHFMDLAGIPSRDRPGPGPVVFAGRLSPEKGADTLIEAAARDGTSLEIAGDGPERARLEELADRRAPGRVRFHGLLPKAEVLALFRSAAAVAVPSRWWENQPMTVLEALATGTPVVASDLGGLSELIEPGVTGVLVPPEDPEALAMAMRPFVAGHPAAVAMGRAGREAVRAGFSPAAHLARLESIYQEAGAVLRVPA